MAFSRRVAELRTRLGISKLEFLRRCGLKSSGAFKNWENDKLPDSSTVERIGDTWLVSLDWLWDKPHTDGDWASPALRNARRLLLSHLCNVDQTPGTSGQRIALCYTLLTETLGLLPGFTEDAYGDWIGWKPSNLRAASAGQLAAQSLQIEHASRFLGGMEYSSAWSLWIQTGHGDALKEVAEVEWRDIAQSLISAKIGPTELARLISILRT